MTVPRATTALLFALSSCDRDKLPESGPAESSSESAPIESSPPDSSPTERFRALSVLVTLDGAPVEGALVVQGGSPSRWTTDASGLAAVQVDTAIDGYLTIMASHDEARIAGEELPSDPADLDARFASGEPLVIALERFATIDNTAYHFQDPGDPDNRDTSNQCGHCHLTISDDWYASAHRSSASNPVVHDLYAGAAAAFDDEDACAEAGGSWMEGILPGTAAAGFRCYLGEGYLPATNLDCGSDEPCDAVASELGDCAACHAPGIDGDLSGRGLLEATAFAFSYGVHCDVCHKVESVDLDAAEPGVAGRLKVLRPTEESPSPVLGEFYPLTFGPYPDVINPRMGAVYREHFQEATLCAGCHMLEHGALVPGTSLDADRWPGGVLPIQSTYDEWLEGPYGEAAPCQSCHMPPDPQAGNSADLGVYIEAPEPDSSTGWYRTPGSVRRHQWLGPRSPDTPMLRLAAALQLQASWEDTTLVVQATVKNVGAGHAIPTGEPMRSMVLLVDATCDGERVPPTGGDAVPGFGGWLARREAGEDWERWPGALVGDVVRVVRRTGGWHDYQGFGPFSDGRFEAEDKGMPVEEVVGSATIVAVDGDRVSFDAALPDGDVAYLGEGSGLPEDGDPVTARAGDAGFAWARVTAGADGSLGVPSFLAVDIASDNRLLPQASWTSSHRFEPACAEPEVTGRLYYRAYPLSLARERGWEAIDVLMAEATP